MSNSRAALAEANLNLDESLGSRSNEFKPKLSPITSKRDIGRKPIQKFGKLALDRIRPDPSQPREEFDESETQKLASSLRRNGQIQPIGVRWNDEEEIWYVVTGERRYRAALAAEIETIECHFLDEDHSESEVLERQLVENLLRKNLAPMEEARAFERLMAKNNWTGRQLAEAIGVSESRVCRSLGLLDLPEEIQRKVADGDLGRSAAYELSKLDDEAEQTSIANAVSAGELPEKTVARKVSERKKLKKTRKNKSGSKTKKLTFFCRHDIKIFVSVPNELNYHYVLEAAEDLTEEVQLRIRSNIAL